MLSLLYQIYPYTVLSAGFLIVFIFFFITYLILFNKNHTRNHKKTITKPHLSLVSTEKNFPEINSDISAIAGENIIATQLDLARACIELNKKEMAVGILKKIMEIGTPKELQEAETLLRML